MRRHNLVVVFYVLYFSWLFTVAFLSPDIAILNLFTSGVVFFYFIFLREKRDWLWFLGSFALVTLFSSLSLRGLEVKYDPTVIENLPLWLPMAWGTTVLALRKFYLIIRK